MAKKGKTSRNSKSSKPEMNADKKRRKSKSKSDQEFELSMALTNAQIWSDRLEVVEKSRQDYKETCRDITGENEKLHEALYRNERDTVDVLAYLKREELIKEEKIEKLNKDSEEFRKRSREDKDNIISQFTKQVTALEKQLLQRTNDIKLLQTELKLVKDFRRNRLQMQSELDDVRDRLMYCEKDHKLTLQKLQFRAFEEKLRLEKEANQKISELAERAHTEAVAKLDETTRSVYKENSRLDESLHYHIGVSERRKSQCSTLVKQVEVLKAENELNDALVHRKARENKRQREKIAELTEKIANLESVVEKTITESREKSLTVQQKAKMETMASKSEIKKLQRIITIRDREMNKVKFLAKNILDQRTMVEIFFHEALEKVRDEIAANRQAMMETLIDPTFQQLIQTVFIRLQYVQAAQDAFKRKMKSATNSGQDDFPKIRTFRKNSLSTNSVYTDIDEAETWLRLGNKVDIRELTWEQKEKVLRMLFAQMNGLKGVKNSKLFDCSQQSTLTIAEMSPGESHNSAIEASAANNVEKAKNPTFITEMDPTKVILPPISQNEVKV